MQYNMQVRTLALWTLLMKLYKWLLKILQLMKLSGLHRQGWSLKVCRAANLNYFSALLQGTPAVEILNKQKEISYFIHHYPECSELNNVCIIGKEREHQMKLLWKYQANQQLSVLSTVMT